MKLLNRRTAGYLAPNAAIPVVVCGDGVITDEQVQAIKLAIKTNAAVHITKVLESPNRQPPKHYLAVRDDAGSIIPQATIEKLEDALKAAGYNIPLHIPMSNQLDTLCQQRHTHIFNEWLLSDAGRKFCAANKC